MALQARLARIHEGLPVGQLRILRRSYVACRLSGSLGSPSQALWRSLDSGRKITMTDREFAEFGHCGGPLGFGELPPPGMTFSCARELVDGRSGRVQAWPRWS
jgi:hypothetical protein